MENGKQSAFATSTPSCSKYDGHLQEGLTKREYFAGLAMQGYCGGEFTGQSGMPSEAIAKFSVELADALLKELDNTTHQSEG